jgi:hypothetical protein
MARNKVHTVRLLEITRLRRAFLLGGWCLSDFLVRSEWERSGSVTLVLKEHAVKKSVYVEEQIASASRQVDMERRWWRSRAKWRSPSRRTRVQTRSEPEGHCRGEACG